MTMTIELPPEVEVRLKDAAAQQGMNTTEFIQVALEAKLRETLRLETERHNFDARNMLGGSVDADKGVLEPMPVLEGFVPIGWKDAIYSKS